MRVSLTEVFSLQDSVLSVPSLKNCKNLSRFQELIQKISGSNSDVHWSKQRSYRFSAVSPRNVAIRDVCTLAMCVV
jgi:hypothetical protein